MTTQKFYLHLGNKDQLNDSGMNFEVVVPHFDWHLFQLIIRLNPDFSCSSSFVLSWLDRFTPWT